MRPFSRFPHPSGITRRQLLQVGGLGLPELLQAGAPSTGRSGASARSCIFLYLYGGPSQIDTWDMKPGAPDRIRGPYQQIATATPGIHLTELMPRFARLSPHYCLVRSMSHKQPEHTRANTMLLTGQSNPAADDPSLGSIMARLRPATQPVPSYVWLQKFGGGAMPPDSFYLSGGFLGPGCAPLATGTKDHTQDPSAPGFRVSVLDSAADISLDRLRERQALLKALDAEDKVLGKSRPCASTTGTRSGHSSWSPETTLAALSICMRSRTRCAIGTGDIRSASIC